MKPLTRKQVVVRIAIIISFAEFLIMLLLQVIPYGAGPYSEAVLDAALLAVLSIPAIYIWVIKPFVDARDKALAQVSRLALTDPVTQLANRRLISKHLGKLITGSVRHKDYGARPSPSHPCSPNTTTAMRWPTPTAWWGCTQRQK